jgi:cytochrome c-type biogenesis protein CcmF
VLAVQGWIGAPSCSSYSSPPTRSAPRPAADRGQDLNPILQDIGLAIHPPLLYLGYVGFSVCFSFAVAALIEGRIDAAWARWVRPWTLAAWMFLTARHRDGLLLGLLRARLGRLVVLGPGGERLLHALARGTALLHSALVMEKRERAEGLDGAARDPGLLAVAARHVPRALRRADLGARLRHRPDARRAHPGILACSSAARFALFAWRAPKLRAGRLFAPISREGALVLNNLFLTTRHGDGAVGTLYPLLLEALTGDKISVGAPFFNLTFGR